MRFLLSILLILGFNANLQAADNGEIAAVVGNDVITVSDINNRMQIALATINDGSRGASLDEKQLLPRVLQVLIDEKLFMQEAAKLEIDVTEDDIKVAVGNIEAQNNLPAGGFDNYLKSNNLPKDSVFDQIRAQVAWSKVLNYKLRPQINVSNKEIEEVLTSTVPENTEVTFRQIHIPVDSFNEEQIDKYMVKLNELRDKIKNCDEAEAMAKSIDKDFSADLQTMSINQIHPNLRDMILILPAGKASKVIKTSSSIDLIIVCSRDATGISKAEKEEIKELLTQKKLSLQAAHYLHDLRKKVYIEIRYPKPATK